MENVLYAHISEDGRKQTLKEHLENVSRMAEDFCIPMLKPMARRSGELHDIGKAAEDFQQRLYGSKKSFCHAACGAIEYQKLSDFEDMIAWLMEYCIASHHTGLLDGQGSGQELATLKNMLGKKYSGSADYSRYKEIVPEVLLSAEEQKAALDELEICIDDNTEMMERFAFFVREVFSCLTDADFLDTEKFFYPNTERGLTGDMEKALEKLNGRFAGFTQTTELQKARGRVQRQAFKNAAETNENIMLLDMPTGSGKTLTAAKIALTSGKKRVIYVIPQISIIEQTADSMEQIFQETMPVLQHHSNYSYEPKRGADKPDEEKTERLLIKTTENWDAPFIVTTSVQFFNSLCHYKSSALRKLHNLRDSILIFDEIHLIPTELLRPCLKAIGYITKYMNSKALFLSATMPDYSAIFKKYMPDVRFAELITDKSDFGYFKKCRYNDLGESSYSAVAELAQSKPNALIVVNKKDTAAEIYRKLSGEKYHLSAFMTPAHRSSVIAKIHERLNEGAHITVVSTSLIEAGVDLDFKCVFREMAGLDSILQSGGRCNREGRYDKGDVYIFKTDEKANPVFDRLVHFTETAVKNTNTSMENIDSEACVKEYYRLKYGFSEEEMDINSIEKFSAAANECNEHTANYEESLPFRSYAEHFQYIESDTTAIIIETPESRELIELLKSGGKSVRRKLQRHSVSVYRYQFETLLKEGVLSEVGGFYLLNTPERYDAETGLIVSAEGEAYFG